MPSAVLAEVCRFLTFFFLLDQLMSNFIIVTDPFHGRILQIDLQTGSVVKIPITATAFGVAFDKSSQTILYSDTVNKTIMSTTLYGKNTSILFSSGNRSLRMIGA